jgi:nucleotide-binding universal stress UspA family protein
MSALAIKTSPATRLKNVLFATDFSDESMHALPYVVGIAKKLGSTVYLAHIVAPNPLVASAPEAAPSLYAGIGDQAAAQLTALALSPQLAALEAKTMVRSGPIGDELCSMIQEHKIDLIVAGTHGRTGVRKLLLGSVVEEICRVATCPVLTVGPALAPRTEIKFKRILFPTDLSEDSKSIIPYLRQIAEEYEAEITILHVMPEELVSNPEAPKLAEPIRSRMIHTFESEFCESKLEFLIGFGETVETILRTARAKNADLIAMGIRNTFFPGVHLHSSAAYRIMAGAHCPVLTYRHEKGE